MIQKYEKQELEKEHKQLSENHKRLELMENNNSTGYIKQVNDLKQKLEKKIEEKDAIEELLTQMNNNKIKITKENEDKVSELQNAYNSLINEIEKHKNQNIQIENVKQELLNEIEKKKLKL
jgi:hypothetical protein